MEDNNLLERYKRNILNSILQNYFTTENIILILI
jgi:hypothetical protein